MNGIVTFHNLNEAIKAGFQIYDKASFGYLVRIHSASGWQLAEVHCK